MNSNSKQNQRVVSGMRSTGALHLGHYHGVLKNWVEMQYEHECFFFAADWHALTTHYKDPSQVPQHVTEMVVDWLAAGISPSSATIFLQSQVPEHAELYLLLSMLTPVSWLERVPTYKDQQQKLKDKDLANIGFLGYPLLQAADILIYKADLVPVGEDQVSHIELTREVARRFNYTYGKEPDFEARAESAIMKMGKKGAKMYRNYRKAYQESGDKEAVIKGQALLDSQQNISVGDRERLLGYLEGISKIILPEPEAILTKSSKMPGLDGQKMSKSYGNTIPLRSTADEVDEGIRKMPTDPARMRRTDAGDPDKCPVWQLHLVYSDEQRQEWVQEGCKTAGIGCLDCKKTIIDAVQAELEPMRERAKVFEEDPQAVRNIILEGSESAREIARETLDDVIEAMRFSDFS
ncbi:MAG TPA: tryptophan--tRNA ligase [Leucothrix mucor]|nr:tryptophan--tRNA ligase [Leucothrix mucor]